MPAREILDGAKFGEWEVLRYAGNKKQLCRCSCGAIQEVSTYSLKSGASTHCKDVTKHIGNGEKAFQDLTNKKFGELKVIKYLGDRKWECL
jgi:hypothetical protein